MHYLVREDAVTNRLDPARAWPDLQSAVVVALNYYSGYNGEADNASRGIIARYGRGRDYHKLIKPGQVKFLERIEADIGRELPAARAYTDTGPVFERELARRAGLGWFGRNTMLVNPRRGSYFFLGTLLLELEAALEVERESFVREELEIALRQSTGTAGANASRSLGDKRG